MKIVQDYKIIRKLNKLIKDGKLPKPEKIELSSFDVEYFSFKIQFQDYDLVIRTEKQSDIARRQQFYNWNSVCEGENFYMYDLLINDPHFLLLDEGQSVLIEKNTKLSERIFNRLAKYHRYGR
jgi:hypothetical protein